MSEIIFKEESYRIMGACFAVYKEMGAGFLENVYADCLELEFQARRIPYVLRPLLALYYLGIELRHGYSPDFLLFDSIILEIKAAKALCDEHRAQTINYLKATGLELGLLVNFGGYPKLEYERFVANKGRYAAVCEPSTLGENYEANK